MFLFKSISIRQFGIFYIYFIIRRVIILELIKLMTHSEAHHELFIAQEKNVVVW